MVQACMLHVWHIAVSADLSGSRFGNSSESSCVTLFVLDAVLQGDQVGEERH
jgi:hypothetical protein